MSDEDLIAYAVGALVAGALAYWQRDAVKAGVSFVVDLTQRGNRLTETYLNVDGSIAEEPTDLAKLAATVVGRDVDVDAYSAARMVRSEEGSQPPEVRQLLVHVLINDAAALGWSLTQTVTYSTNPDRNTLYGFQTSRRYSTAVDPYEQDLYLAEQVIAARAAGGADPTGGATKFFSRGLAMNPLPQAWLDQGYVAENVDPAPDRLVFFRKA
jgi:hypothetical protein